MMRSWFVIPAVAALSIAATVVTINATTSYLWNTTIVTNDEVVVGRKFAYGGRYQYAMHRRTGEEELTYIDKRFFGPEKYVLVEYDPSCRCISRVTREASGIRVSFFRNSDGKTANRMTGAVAIGLERIPISDAEPEFAEADKLMSSYRERHADLLPPRR